MPAELTEAIWLDERGVVTIVELAQCSGLSERELRDLVELGALSPLEAEEHELRFDARCIVAARTASRLRHDFELDVHGLALALSLLERVQELEAEVNRLRAAFPRMLR